MKVLSEGREKKERKKVLGIIGCCWIARRRVEEQNEEEKGQILKWISLKWASNFSIHILKEFYFGFLNSKILDFNCTSYNRTMN